MMLFPDVKEHMKKLHTKLTAEQCQMALGVPCSQASMWACLCAEALGLKVAKDKWWPSNVDNQGRITQQEGASRTHKQVQKLAQLAEEYHHGHHSQACSPKVLFQLLDWEI